MIARSDRLEAAVVLLRVAFVVPVLVAVAVPIALVGRARPSPAQLALSPSIVTGPPLRPAGRPVDVRFAPGDPPVPASMDLYLRAVRP